MENARRLLQRAGYYILSLLIGFFYVPAFGQSSKGVIKGKIVDARTNQPLQGVIVGKRDTAIITRSNPDGNFSIVIDKGQSRFFFQADGYQTLIVEQTKINPGAIVPLLVFLKPILDGTLSGPDIVSSQGRDSISIFQLTRKRSLIAISSSARVSHEINWSYLKDDLLFQNAAVALAPLPGLNVIQIPSVKPSFTLMNSGISGRYNQLFINGTLNPGIGQVERLFDFTVLPAEMLESTSVLLYKRASMPGEFGVANINIQTKTSPDRNFFYLQLGTQFQGNRFGDDFVGEKRDFNEWLSGPSLSNKLPDGFPNARTETRLSQKNPQERVDLLKTLPNNLAPSELATLGLGDRFVLGWGRNIKLKESKLGLVAYLNHQATKEIFKSEVSVAPNVASNPYPFSRNDLRVVNSQSDNTNFQQASHLTAYLGSAIEWNKSRISFAAVYTGQKTFLHTQRNYISKPDEDSVADRGIRNFQEQRRTVNLMLNGAHAMGEKGKFRFDWKVGYNNFKQSNPDDRSFLLRRDSVNNDFYEIAHQQTQPLPDRNNVGRNQLLANLDAIFPNSSRSWKDVTDHFFTASGNLSAPIQLFHRSSILSGGVYLQTQYRELTSDILLYEGAGSFTIDGLLAPQRYFPGGLDAEEYFTNVIGATGSFNPNEVNPDNYANYLGSATVGAAYINNEMRLSRNISVEVGLRFESTSQLVSLSEFHYFEGYKNAEKITLDENIYVSYFDLLPVASISYRPLNKFAIMGHYSRSLNRPMLQELSDYRSYDPDQFMVTTGNRLLANSTIDHFNVNLEFKPSTFSHFSLRGFYKKIYQPIEYLVTGFASSTGNLKSTPHNMPAAEVYGVTLSLNVPLSSKEKSWLSKSAVFFSSTLVESEVKRGPIKSTGNPFVETHTLAGTPDYALNAGIIASAPGYPALMLSLNTTGDFISAVGSGSITKLINEKEVLAIPHYYTKGRTQMDLQLSQEFFRSVLRVSVGANNIFQESFITYQDLNGNKKFDEPLVVYKANGGTGRYAGGIDNTTYKREGVRSFYVRLSFKIQN
ncbi:MAG: TonB-dependent receptor [Chitinophagaceae bacterium]|nr:TonB-dependent receptor [Chitinophagaceae bacterium]